MAPRFLHYYWIYFSPFLRLFIYVGVDSLSNFPFDNSLKENFCAIIDYLSCPNLFDGILSIVNGKVLDQACMSKAWSMGFNPHSNLVMIRGALGSRTLNLLLLKNNLLILIFMTNVSMLMILACIFLLLILPHLIIQSFMMYLILFLLQVWSYLWV